LKPSSLSTESFVTEQRDPLYIAGDTRHKVTATWHSRCQRPSQIVNLNAQASSYTYDALCRLTRVDKPGGGFVITSYELAPILGPLGDGKIRRLSLPPSLDHSAMEKSGVIGRRVGRGCRPSDEALQALRCRSHCAVGPRCSLDAKPRIFARLRRGS
jgi:hypothetical protein